MAAPTTADDPIRREVERRLTEIFTAFVPRPPERGSLVVRTLTLPCRTVRRLAEPFAVVRSIVELGLGRVGATNAADQPPPATTAPVRPAETPSAPAARHIVGGSDLPIDEYESLAASQVVARLGSLTDDELGRVRAFEAANRSRRTVIGKVDQLLASR